jgi:phage tail-like protein
MSAPDYYPPSGFYFRLQLGGGTDPEDSAFQEASGLSVEIEAETVAEGGVNSFRHRLPTQAKYEDLVLKRGYVTKDHPLFVWCRETLRNEFAKPIVPKTLSLQLLAPRIHIAELHAADRRYVEKHSDGPEILQQWNFVGAWPRKWSVSDLATQKNDVLIETLQFAYRYFTVGTAAEHAS